MSSFSHLPDARFVADERTSRPPPIAYYLLSTASTPLPRRPDLSSACGIDFEMRAVLNLIVLLAPCNMPHRCLCVCPDLIGPPGLLLRHALRNTLAVIIVLSDSGPLRRFALARAAASGLEDGPTSASRPPICLSQSHRSNSVVVALRMHRSSTTE